MGSTTTAGSTALLNRTSDSQPSGGTKPPGRWNSRSHPVDPFELSRRLRIVLAQQQKTDLSDAAAGCPDLDSYANRLLAAGCTNIDDYTKKLLSAGSGTVRPPAATTAQTALESSLATTVKSSSIARKPAKPIPKLPKLADPPLSRSSTRHYLTAFSPPAATTADTAAAIKTSASAPSYVYVPQQAAQQFAWTTVTPILRKGSTSLQRHHKKTSRQEDDPFLAEVAEETKVLPKPNEQPHQHPPQQSYVAKHALKDALIFPNDSESGNKHNRKILTWAHGANNSKQDQHRLSSFAAEQDNMDRYKTEDRGVVEAEARQDWSIVFAPIDPHILDLHRVDWTQKDEAAQPPLPTKGQKPGDCKGSGIRRSKSLWVIRSRSRLTQGSKTPADAQATSLPSALTSPSLSLASPGPKPPHKLLKTPTINGLFSLFKH